MPTVRYTVINGEVIAEKRNGVRRLYVPDPLGSTVALVDNTQTITDRFSYWPYGEEASRTGTTPTPFRFVGTQGYHRDAANRTYVRARVLRTDVGRWMSQDPAGLGGGDVQLHGYVGNPVTWSDASGRQWRPTPHPPWYDPSQPICFDPFGGREWPPPRESEGPLHGTYCGPQGGVAHGRPIDALDACCMAHDECFAAARPPCTWINQLWEPACSACNSALCACAMSAPCPTWGCAIARAVVAAYACVWATWSVPAPSTPVVSPLHPPLPRRGGVPVYY